MLHLDMQIGETLILDDGRIKITFNEKNGHRTRVSVDADKSIKIDKVLPVSGPEIGLRKK